MVTITEDYVSFETALLLKKKGFEQVGCQTTIQHSRRFMCWLLLWASCSNSSNGNEVVKRST